MLKPGNKIGAQRFLPLWVSFCLLAGYPVALPAKIEWEKLDEVQLKQTTFEEAPEAPAVVLFDRGKMLVDLDLRKQEPFVEYEKYMRLKILNQAGYEYATFRILYQKEDLIEGLEARTVLPDGRIIELKKDDFHRNTIKTGGSSNILYELAFTFPALEPGCIIEHKYTKRTKNILFMDKWYFSNRLYTFRSEFTGEVSSLFIYNYYLFPPGLVMPEREETEYLENGMKRIKARFVWVLENLPGVVSEPFSPPWNSRRIQLFFALSAFRPPAYGGFSAEKVPIYDTWDSAAKSFYRMSKDIITDSKEIQAAVQKCCADKTEKKDKIDSIFKYLKEHCNYIGGGQWELFPAAPKATLESGKGDAADISALMIQMLRDAGIEAYPALITTRSDPPFLRNFPSPTQFSKMIVYVYDTQKPQWIDPSCSFACCRNLPWEDQGQTALIVNSEKGSFSTTAASKPAENFVSHYGLLTIGTDGDSKLEGWVAYSGLQENLHAEKLQPLTELDRRKYVKDLTSPFTPDAELAEYDMPEDLRAGAGLRIGYSLSSPSLAQIVSDRLLLNPAFFHRISAGPFEAQQREFPVFFEYPYTINATLKIEVPEGFALVKVPQTAKFSRPYGDYLRYLERDGQAILYHKKFTLPEIIFPPENYPEIQKYYQQLEALDEELLVFRKRGAVAGQDSTAKNSVSATPK